MTTNRTVRAPRGPRLSCKGWHQEAALRCLMNNLDPDVAERPSDLVVYGGRGKATNKAYFLSIAITSSSQPAIKKSPPKGVMIPIPEMPTLFMAFKEAKR